jgi:hypothetical protein
MNKAILIPLCGCFLMFNTLKATDILQPSNGNSVIANVKSGDKFYDSGGPNADYFNCNVGPGLDNEQTCTSSMTICGQGFVALKFNSFGLFASSGGGDNIKIYSGFKELYNSLKEVSPVGKIFTSTSGNGCLIIKFLATSIHATFGWEAEIIVNPSPDGTVLEPQPLPNGSCNLSCISHVNASMPADVGCTRTFTAADFLQNPTLGCQYTVSLSYPFGTNAPGGGVVDRSHLGYTFIYQVNDASTQNSCWGYVTIEDKAGPQPGCKGPRKISCAQLNLISQLTNKVVDNCGESGSSAFESLSFTDWGCNDVRGIGQVIRMVRTWDAWGNTSTCKDTLTIGRDSLKNIKCPSMVPLTCKTICGTQSIQWIKDKELKSVFDPSKPSQMLYPSPDNLLAIHPGTSSNGNINYWIPKDTLIVPAIWDSVAHIFIGATVNGIKAPDTCRSVRECVPLWPIRGGICKTTVGYTDEILDLCPLNGSAFKVRRQWRIVDWCTGRDTVCIQYIKVEDTEAPVLSGEKNLMAEVSPHDCYADVKLFPLVTDDCSPVDQSYTIEFNDLNGRITILNGPLNSSTIVRLPSLPYGDCIPVKVRATDQCLNTSTSQYEVCVYDITPPTPVCDEYTVTTLDPATCWARVYAQDLDNGSHDNCCNVLHFAVASMASIDSARKVWTDYWTKNCFTDYWAHKTYDKRDSKGYFYDGFLEQWINCFVFKDYIDLTDCGDNQVVLRVYEACGVPRYDAHVFPCSLHDWFTYNTYGVCRAFHNYNFFHRNGLKDCAAKLPLLCRSDYWTWFDKAEAETPNPFPADVKHITAAFYSGATSYSSFIAQNCSFFFPLTELDNSYPTAPGNRCSARLYNDCMINVHVDDKTPPVCDGLRDLFYYCDGVNSTEDKLFEYARLACSDESYLTDNFTDYTCIDDLGNPYNNVECKVEHDADLTDTLDGTGVKAFGWYGCNIYGPAHNDEHGTRIDPCPSGNQIGMNTTGDSIAGNGYGNNSYAPIYCHTWLCLDKYDQAGKKATPEFWKPELHNLGSNGPIVKGTEGGQFKIWDNCTIGTPEIKDASYVDNCGNGWLSRTWTVGDKCGTNKISCTQKIFTKHRSDFEVMFPADLTVSCDATGDLSTNGAAGKPMIMDDECELIGVNFTDVQYDIIPGACYKIVRTWTVIDWCKYDPQQYKRDPEVIVDDRAVADPVNRYCVYRKLKDDGDGYITYTQIIKVVDSIPPVVTCRDTVICYFGGYDGNGPEPAGPNCSVPSYISPYFTATDNCTPPELIQFRYELDLNNDGVIDRKSGPNVKNFTSIGAELSQGKHKLWIIASDKCGQDDTTSCFLEVKDCKKPTPYCYNGIATVIMPSSGEITVWATDLNSGSYDNCTKKSNLRFSFDSAGLTPSRVFKCSDVLGGVSAIIPVNMYVKDEAGNVDFCSTYLLIEDGSGNICPDITGTAALIAGKVMTEITEPVEHVILDIKSSNPGIPAFKTDANGTYSFAGLPMNGNYTIIPRRDDDPSNGVSTIDLVLIQKHILGVQQLNSAYKVIAADVDHSNDVSVIDLVELRKLILTIYDKMPNNTSWRFVPKSFVFNDINNPWSQTFPEKIDISSITQDELKRDFIGIKIGDVNGTVVPHSLLGTEIREVNHALVFRTEDRHLKAGEEATINFTSENFKNIEGYQFSLAMKDLELIAVHSGVLKLNEGNFGMTKLGEGYVTTSWNDSKGISAGNDDVLFNITVKATRPLTLSEALVINSKFTRAEAYASQAFSPAYHLGVALEVGIKSLPGYALHQNTPNPFQSTTVISYNLARNDKVNLKITDITGRVIKVYAQNGQKGYNQLTLNRADIRGAGVLYYTIETKEYSATKKMIVID